MQKEYIMGVFKTLKETLKPSTPRFSKSTRELFGDGVNPSLVLGREYQDEKQELASELKQTHTPDSTLPRQKV